MENEVIGIANYRRLNGSVYDYREVLGPNGKCLKDGLEAEVVCLVTYFSFLEGGRKNANIPSKISQAGYDWYIRFKTPLGCGKKRVRKVLTNCGMLW
jgi:hypothetical protein